MCWLEERKTAGWGSKGWHFGNGGTCTFSQGGVVSGSRNGGLGFKVGGGAIGKYLPRVTEVGMCEAHQRVAGRPAWKAESPLGSEMEFPGSSDGKESACNVGDPSLIPRLGRSPGEGNGNPLQYSCLENPKDRGTWWATVHGVAKSQTWLNDFILGTWSLRVERDTGAGCGDAQGLSKNWWLNLDRISHILESFWLTVPNIFRRQRLEGSYTQICFWSVSHLRKSYGPPSEVSTVDFFSLKKICWFWQGHPGFSQYVISMWKQWAKGQGSFFNLSCSFLSGFLSVKQWLWLCHTVVPLYNTWYNLNRFKLCSPINITSFDIASP